MSMISNALITGGIFCQNVGERHVYTQTQKSAMDRLQEAVAHSAFHNSGQRPDPPKCHPNTRVTVLNKIENWTLRTDPDTREISILWLSGAAGAGKSAIAQTLAEHFHSKGLLIASFFFGRSDSTRNHARPLVSTIAYQLYSLLPPTGKGRLLGIIDDDPLIFTKSLIAQFETLVINPLQHSFENRTWASVCAPRLVIIDGLDECLDHGMRRNVLLMLSAAVRQFYPRLIFMLASRAEHDIQAMFNSSDLLNIHTRLFLDDTYLPDQDIELFLRERFEECRTSHPFRHLIPPDWPSNEIMRKMTSKSSGQFIYASVVVKYVTSSRHRPHHRLDVVLNLRPASGDLPFSELDALYTHIFCCVEDIDVVLKILSFDIIYRNLASVEDIERILRLDPGDIPILLCDLASVIGYQEGLSHGPRLKILHASLSDYLLDRTRSKHFYIDTISHCAEHAANCLRFLSRFEFGNPSMETMPTAIFFFEYNYHSLDLTESLYNAIKGFSIPRIYNSVTGIYPELYRNVYQTLQQFTFRFLPALFSFLEKSESTNNAELIKQHQTEYDAFLRQSLKAYPLESPSSLVLALISVYRDLPLGAFHDRFRLFDHTEFEDRDLFSLQLRIIRTGDVGYMRYLSDFLRDRRRSRECCAGPKLFARAAMYCLYYLCDHKAFEQKSPRMPPRQGMRRIYTPWKWRRQVIREDIGGWRATPWLWIRRPKTYGSISRTRVPHRRSNDLIYIHAPFVDISLPSAYNDPVVMYRVNTEKYYLALVYLIYFLPRAAKFDDLVHMCQKQILASRSQDFPRESAQARACMQKYSTQWD
ncbi:hypothetical protein D9619_007559 [Psilocybe cf. subviscida]|uniref:Nephrocystin 3-like N-terminal domain-containing protein n=1 Tax=Psilocybe cf. subviscida TaxID=2480587 RepID=A0A8H5EWL4_9AGAR|nr:hypothetical protein D9619_007559 [Psilocybe cf. subviscida]